MVKTILFVDSVCPRPYQVDDLAAGRMGGTEASVLRLSKALSERYRVVIAQRGRLEPYHDIHNISYKPLDDKLPFDPAVVITLRDAKTYRQSIQSYANSIHYLWMHDIVAGAYQEHVHQCLEGFPSHLIAVSNWHKTQIFNALPTETLAGTLKVTVIYNLIADYCVKDPFLTYDPKKLIFTSSPHKGLDQVLEIFAKLRERDPEYKLYLANPGYYPDKTNLPEGVFSLGDKLSHRELLKEIGTSLCLFYPQNVFEETFGLVYAESNAVGTPVLAVNIGAALEVLENNHQLVPKKLDAILDTVQQWSKGNRPTVHVNRSFTTSEVLRTWNKLFMFGNVG